MRENASQSRKNQYSRSVAPVRTNDGELIVADIWPATPRISESRADFRCAAALNAATAKIVRLEQQLVERDTRIAERDKRIAELEGLIAALEHQVEHLAAREEDDTEIGEHLR